jgi:group I intron endonuclease
MKRAGIYCIENLINGKKYMGQGVDVEKRIRQSHQNNNALNSAIKKYGKENFKRYIVIYSEIFELNRLEVFCIKIFHSHVPENGYNISFGGNSPMLGRNHSAKTKNNMSMGHIGEKNSFFGKHHSEESLIKMRVPKTDETKNKISIANTGRKKTEDEKKRRSGANHVNFGKHLPEQTKKNISDGNLGKKKSNSSSKYFGVCIKNNNNKPYVYWICSFYVDGEKVRLGMYKRELDAALAYDDYVRKNSLDRPLNFP